MKTIVTSVPTLTVRMFHKDLMEEETVELMEFDTFDALVAYGQENSENKVVTIATHRTSPRKDGSLIREVYEFINF